MLIFRRLLGFLRPYKRGVTWSFALAFGAMGATVLIPYLTGRAIDAIRDHDHHGLWVWAIAIAVAGLARLGLSVFRRLVAGRVSLGVEVDLRNLLYGVQPFDPFTLSATVLMLFACASIALLGPVRRATQVDPISVMR